MAAGILLRGGRVGVGALCARLDALGLMRDVIATDAGDGKGVVFRLADPCVHALAPGADTIGLCGRLCLDPVTRDEDLEREIFLALLLSPMRFECAGFDELQSLIRIRKNIVRAARKTELAFDTTAAAERPSDCWAYSREQGFTVLPGKPLIEALRKATQPEITGQCYAFSCYRATEYVILLGIAEELEVSDPDLLDRLQRQWETRAIKSGLFHEVFLVEYGSMEAPVPSRYYIPGDRLWFRNPDGYSSDVTGYEGSWVIYLGGGLFTNFWKHQQTYSLTSKCLEIYHWRHGVYRDHGGALRMDEDTVESHVQASLENPREVDSILSKMMRLRDPQGVYLAGGCIDATREYARPVTRHAPAYCLPDV